MARLKCRFRGHILNACLIVTKAVLRFGRKIPNSEKNVLDSIVIAW
ncbi:MAG: hypothetical protein GX107_03950 [Clostridiales bacterium]|nr:hypothetical protein [Clostridiales bacterium]